MCIWWTHGKNLLSYFISIRLIHLILMIHSYIWMINLKYWGFMFFLYYLSLNWLHKGFSSVVWMRNCFFYYFLFVLTCGSYYFKLILTNFLYFPFDWWWLLIHNFVIFMLFALFHINKCRLFKLILEWVILNIISFLTRSHVIMMNIINS